MILTRMARLSANNVKHNKISTRKFIATDAKVAGETKVPLTGTNITPPPPPAKKPQAGGGGGGNSTILLLLAVAGGGAAYYYQDELSKALGGGEKKSAAPPAAAKPAAAAVSPAAAAAAPVVAKQQEPKPAELKKEIVDAEKRLKEVAEPSPVDYKKVREAIVNILDDPNHDDGSWGPVFIRLAWHSAGTYDKVSKTGGSEAATMRFAPESDWGANAGLHLARARLEPIKKQFPGISYADLWVLAADTAIEEMGGPKCNFRAGRVDAKSGPSPVYDGRLPDADGRNHKENPANHLRDIFYRMGFNDQEIVALSGAHGLGRCHTDRSGFWGPWTRAPTTFSNDYFKLLLQEKWTPKKTHEGKPWNGPAQFEDKTGELMMLPTDLALVSDPKMRVWVEKYAADQELFFKDFEKAWTKLMENGVKKFQGRWWLFGY